MEMLPIWKIEQQMLREESWEKGKTVDLWYKFEDSEMSNYTVRFACQIFHVS